MKFEAEIIKDIVDSRGHTKTSIHYQSECVEEWVKEVEGAYPKLCDYQSEWLNYSNENIGIFPYVTLTDVTNATVENVVPYAYKSAMLKGQTLVNYAQITDHDFNNGRVITQDLLKPLEIGKTYTIIMNIVSQTATTGIITRFAKDSGNYTGVRTFNGLGLHKYSFTPTIEFNQFAPYVELGEYESGLRASYNQLMILEGDYTNIDIPFFEGMQSVQLPVLSTVGKNLASINNIENIQIGIGDVISRKIFDISLKPNTKYSIKTDVITSGLDKIRIRIYKNVGDVYTLIHDYLTKDDVVGTFTTPNELVDYFVTAHSFDKNYTTMTGLQIEEGATISPYEPYQSNILSTPSDLELRGIGDVQDTLDCLTGEVTERIGEVVLDGSNYEWVIDKEHENNVCFRCYDWKDVFKINGKILCDKFASKSVYDNDIEGIHLTSVLRLGILKSKLSALNVDGLNDYLSQNPITLQYQLAEESIKSVNLSVVDQDGNTLKQIKPIEGTMHLNTSGETIKPLFSGEIPVEAITQNLASFIEE